MRDYPPMSNPSATPLSAQVVAAVQNLVIGPAAIEFADSLKSANAAIVTAEPGAGKTTGVPLALLGAQWLSQRNANGIVIVEPRRVAARQAAARMASMLGQQLSSKERGLVGLRSRDETFIGRATRIEVVTDGVLPRMLRADPGFSGRSVVIFDEFHERSLDTDLGLALALSAQSLLRPDLIVIVMSATLDVDRVESLLAQHSKRPVLKLCSPGRAFPVDISSYTAAGDLAQRVADTTIQAVKRSSGDVLIFLPGVHEINMCARRLRNQASLQHTTVLALHARGTAADTAHALRPSLHGEQRIVLATSLAQTSVTIDGVTTVIDSGFIRRPVRDPATGLSRLATMRVSKATATQRAGRAGRTAPGAAIQLWSAAEWAQFDETERPEILDADLVGMALAAADWGVNPLDLAWTDPPSVDSWAQARRELAMLGAIDQKGLMTELGSMMASIPTHPRISALLATTQSTQRSPATILAAYLSDSDWFGPGAPMDLVSRLAALVDLSQTNNDFVSHASRQRFRSALQRMARSRQLPTTADLDRRTIGALALRAFPERLAVQFETSGDRFQFANGLVLPLDSSPLSDSAAIVGAQMIVALELDSDRKRGLIRVAAVVDPDQVTEWAKSSEWGSIRETVTTQWENDRLNGSEVTELVTPVGSLTLRRRPTIPARSVAIEAVANLLANNGEAAEAFAWTEAAKELWARMQLDGSVSDDSWQRMVIAWLHDTMPASNRPFTLASVDIHAALAHHLSVSGSAHQLARRAPTTITVHERSHRIHYSTDSGRPTIRVRVQDLFGLLQIPSICDGSQPLTIEMLSPAGRIVGVTDDLHRFWTVGYPGLRSDLRGRYPKHQWPEDPTQAAPRRTAPRR